MHYEHTTLVPSIIASNWLNIEKWKFILKFLYSSIAKSKAGLGRGVIPQSYRILMSK